MNHRLVEASHVRGHILHLRFSDGLEGDIDLADELDGEVFEPLRNVAFFRRFEVDPQLRTIVWPNGADFAPEFLRERIRISA
ncbi:MAG: hypothetical protein ABS55_03010 [Lautropia sp. SCN 70-15]|jgi:hypothetical protein|nr:MAG: hypothetical protein ABS55_03010 [Lautropia sp. SCN 70-15]